MTAAATPPPPPDVRAPAVKVLHRNRTRKQSEHDITTVTMRMRAVAADPATYLASLAVPVRPPRTPGRPGDYPHWAYTVFNSLIRVNGSARTVAEDLQDPVTWQAFVDGAREHLGPRAVEGVPATGPKRHHWNTWAATYGAHNVAPLGEAFRALALAQARSQGLLDPDAPGTLARPHRTTFVGGDGKVMSAPCRNRTAHRIDRTTGEIVGTQRVDPASSDWKEGGTTDDGKDRWEFGSKFVCLSARDDAYYGRVVLDVEHLPAVKGNGGEAGLAVRMLLRLKNHAGDGMKAVVYDGALNGVHIDPLMRAGLLVVNPMTAAENPKGDRKGTRRVEKTAVLDEYKHDNDNDCPGHDLVAADGHVHERQLTADAHAHDEPLPYRLVARGTDGQRRWYHEIKIACGARTHTTTVPVYRITSDADKGRKNNPTGFNRAEYLRQVPPKSDDYQAVYPYRQDAESLNCQLEAANYFHRLPAYGAARQTLVMIGAVMSENSVSRYHHQRRQPQDTAAA